jgi:hypothetical protein
MEVWTCEIQRWLKEDKEMATFFDSALDTGPISLRDAYFGGRTGPMKLYAKAANGLKIGYKDFCSLYPAAMESTEYPLGHPLRTVHNEVVQWTSSAQNPYKGIVKGFIVPPKNLSVPVVPFKTKSGRLIFPLCRKCCLENDNGLKSNNYRCSHPDDQRGWVATLTHLEMNRALDRGYKMTYLVRSLTWSQWSSDLFKPFIQ